MKKILILLQVLAFIPFFFGTFLFIVQTFTNFYVIVNVKEYKSGNFIISYRLSESLGRTGHITFAYGIIGDDTVRVSVGHILEHQSTSEIGDTVYVWYKNDKKQTLVRDKYDTTFNIYNYIYQAFPNLMLFGIPPFIIITYILRRMKKKSLNQNNLQ